MDGQGQRQGHSVEPAMSENRGGVEEVMLARTWVRGYEGPLARSGAEGKLVRVNMEYVAGRSSVGSLESSALASVVAVVVEGGYREKCRQIWQKG